jgi:hypothetical protein
MRSQHDVLSAALHSCAPLPALVIGVIAMWQLGVSTLAWSTNIAATIVGVLIWLFGRRLPPVTRRGTRASLTAASIATIILPFASGGILGVYRWLVVAGLRLHVSAIVAPLIILCVAAAAPHGITGARAIGITAATILALQPDTAQTISLAAACAVILAYARPVQPRNLLVSIVLLCAASAVSFIRPDRLPPVAHVEEIFGIVTSNGPGSPAMATVALLLLPAPFFAAWHRHRRSVTLALGVYIALTLLAPAWGTFPVPVMGYGASPILGYFIALTAGLGGLSHIEESAATVASSSST